MPHTTRDLFVAWTMDCETVAQESQATGGPADWDLSERAIRGYAESLTAHGYRVTLFVIPRLGEVQSAMFRELAEAGVEVGMHMHPQTSDYGYGEHLGSLPVDIQRDLLRSGRDRLAQVLGQAPTSYRSGCFSASNETFGILADLGFTQGSVSLPGRHLPAVGAMWRGAHPFAHFASRTDRLAAGDLPFYEVPTAVDPDDVDLPLSHQGDARHLRLERERYMEWASDLARRYVQAQLAAGQGPLTMVVMTHNTQEYGDRAAPARVNLEATIAALDRITGELGLRLRPATLAQVRAEVAPRRAAPPPGRD